MSSLADKVLDIHRRLESAGIPHAVGGALALAYHTGEPRATIDIDVNVFVGVSQAGRVLGALEGTVSADARDRRALARDGQVRLFWDDTALDLFFATVPFHSAAAARVEQVPFFGAIIAVLSATDLSVCKVVFSRDKDWADLRAMAEAGTPDPEEVLSWVRDILGPCSPNEERARALFAEVAASKQGDAALPRIPARPPRRRRADPPSTPVDP